MTDRVDFAKYHGTGNDFIIVVDLDGRHEIDAATAAALCDRRFGIGADGTIRIAGDEAAAFFMDHRNADGTHAEMCGNGIRCLAKLVVDRGLAAGPTLDVMTRAGLRRVTVDLDDGEVVRVTVGMGAPRFQLHEIPMRGPAWETFIGRPLEVGEMTFTASALSMGNPHLVLFCDEDVARYHVAHIGAGLERHERFPERTNVEFVHARDGGLDVRVWERGVGETMACGTGACAALVAASDAGLVGRRSIVRFPGGAVEVERRADDDAVLLTGSATHVFDGVVDLDRLRHAAEVRSRGANAADPAPLL
jgi:diaminopimelate epimerase